MHYTNNFILYYVVSLRHNGFLEAAPRHTKLLLQMVDFCRGSWLAFPTNLICRSGQ